MPEFETYLQQYFDISPDDWSLMAAAFQLESLKRGDYFLHSGSASNRLSFPVEGMLRIFVNKKIQSD
jgi:hypothetical protein